MWDLKRLSSEANVSEEELLLKTSLEIAFVPIPQGWSPSLVFRALKSLVLIQTNLTTLSWCSPDSFPSLEFLSLPSNHLESLSSLSSEMVGLRELNLTGNAIVSMECEVLSGGRSTDLTSLILDSNALVEFNPGDLSLPSLKTLSLAGNHLSELPVGAVPPSVECLDLSGNNWNSPFDLLKALVALPALSSLSTTSPTVPVSQVALHWACEPHLHVLVLHLPFLNVLNAKPVTREWRDHAAALRASMESAALASVETVKAEREAGLKIAKRELKSVKASLAELHEAQQEADAWLESVLEETKASLHETASKVRAALDVGAVNLSRAMQQAQQELWDAVGQDESARAAVVERATFISAGLDRQEAIKRAESTTAKALVGRRVRKYQLKSADPSLVALKTFQQAVNPLKQRPVSAPPTRPKSLLGLASAKRPESGKSSSGKSSCAGSPNSKWKVDIQRVYKVIIPKKAVESPKGPSSSSPGVSSLSSPSSLPAPGSNSSPQSARSSLPARAVQTLYFVDAPDVVLRVLAAGTWAAAAAERGGVLCLTRVPQGGVTLLNFPCAHTKSGALKGLPGPSLATLVCKVHMDSGLQIVPSSREALDAVEGGAHPGSVLASLASDQVSWMSLSTSTPQRPSSASKKRVWTVADPETGVYFLKPGAADISVVPTAYVRWAPTLGSRTWKTLAEQEPVDPLNDPALAPSSVDGDALLTSLAKAVDTAAAPSSDAAAVYSCVSSALVSAARSGSATREALASALYSLVHSHAGLQSDVIAATGPSSADPGDTALFNELESAASMALESWVAAVAAQIQLQGS